MKLQLDKVGTIGIFVAALFSPCCFPLFGFVLTALGLGSFELFGGWTMKIFQGLTLVSVVGIYLSYRKHRDVRPLIIALISMGIIFISYYGINSESWYYFLYAGMVGLMIATFVNYRVAKRSKMKVNLKSTITCPVCGFQKEEIMPEDACRYFYQCESCNTILKPLTGDCCVFCSYGSEKCPPVQKSNECCKRI